MQPIYSSNSHFIKNPHAFLDALESPSLLIQCDTEQVVTANITACELFGKDLSQIEGRTGGQVIDCVYAYEVDDYCKGLNCENCKLKKALVKTFATAQSIAGVQTILEIKKENDIEFYFMQVSTEKIGNMVLVIVDSYKKMA